MSNAVHFSHFISYHSSHPGLWRLRHIPHGEDTSHSLDNPEKPLDEALSAREDPKALYRAAYKPQSDRKTIHHVA